MQDDQEGVWFVLVGIACGRTCTSIRNMTHSFSGRVVVAIFEFKNGRLIATVVYTLS
jgi:hypothetical protein